MRNKVLILLALIAGMAFATSMRPICGVVQDFLLKGTVVLFVLAIIFFSLSRFWKSKSKPMGILAIASFILAIIGFLVYFFIPIVISALLGVPVSTGPCAGY